MDVTVHRPVRDAYGDVTDETTHTVSGVMVAPRMSSESDQGGERVVVGLTIYAPYGADIEPTDSVTVRGERYDVKGERGDWQNPWTDTQAGSEVALERSS